MPLVQKTLIVVALCIWVGLWWLALRIVAGRRFGLVEWIPVALLAFGIPTMASEIVALNLDPDWAEGFKYFLFGWFALVLIIDGVWAIRKLIRGSRV